MAGSYQNKKTQIIHFLEDWIKKVVTAKLWRTFTDLHIDEIDKEFKEQKNWISGSLFLLSCIDSLIDKSTYSVLLAIPLSCLSTPSRIDFMELTALESQLGLTPPSFYIFPKAEKDYEATVKSSIYLVGMSAKLTWKAYYNEKQENDEYYRTIYLENQIT